MQNAKTYTQFVTALAQNSVVNALYSSDYLVSNTSNTSDTQRHMLTACIQMLLQDSNIKALCVAQHNTTCNVLLEEAIYDDLYDLV